MYTKCMKRSYGEYAMEWAAMEGKLELIKYFHKKEVCFKENAHQKKKAKTYHHASLRIL